MKDLRILDEGSLRWIVDLATFTPKAQIADDVFANSIVTVNRSSFRLCSTLAVPHECVHSTVF